MSNRSRRRVSKLAVEEHAVILGERAPRGLYVVISLAVGLLMAEGLVRGFTYVGGEAGRQLAARDPMATVVIPHGEFGYRQRPNMDYTYGNGARAIWNSAGYRGSLVTRYKPQGTFRIILLGGSTTHGFGVDNDETIDAHMRELLGNRYPGVQFEVVNLAMDGYDSYQLFERMRTDGVGLSPDLVIVNSGINDVRNARFANLANPDPRALIWEPVMEKMREEAKRGGPSLWTLIKHYSYVARVPRYIRELLVRRNAIQAMPMVEPQPDAVDYFEVNLLRTMALAEEAGAGVLLSTPPSALTMIYEPSDMWQRDYWIGDAATTEEYRQRLSRRMMKLTLEQQALGRNVAYISHDLLPEQFLDDAHLTAEGNQTVAANFIESARPFIEAAFPQQSQLK